MFVAGKKFRVFLIWRNAVPPEWRPLAIIACDTHRSERGKSSWHFKRKIFNRLAVTTANLFKNYFFMPPPCFAKLPATFNTRAFFCNVNILKQRINIIYGSPEFYLFFSSSRLLLLLLLAPPRPLFKGVPRCKPIYFAFNLNILADMIRIDV